MTPTTQSEDSGFLRASGVSKAFGHVQAVSGVDISIARGEVVALVGDNGAGKSTLIGMLCGALQPDEGTLCVAGSEVEFTSPRDARARGVAVVYQDLALVNVLDVAHNVFLGQIPTKRWMVDRRYMATETSRVLSELGINVPPIGAPVEMLSGGQRQTIAISRAVRQGGEVMIMDEPTAALGVQESRKVLQLIERLRSRGLGVLVVSHNLEHVFSIADRIVVLRGGRLVGSRVKTQTTHAEIVHMIIGADLEPSTG